MAELVFTPATADQLPLFDAIRVAAYAPVFASFRSLLGDHIYEIAQARDDAAQAELLVSLMRPDSGWEVYAAKQGAAVVGFVSLRCNDETKVGEIGLNAVHPEHGGRGIGTRMYEFAVSRLEQAGMRVAMVGTGGDASHAPARRAYEKAGFDRQIPSVWMYRRLD
ncbi:MAG TPA: GNAT family N-acetyltransferase [Polyangiales bacterium]|nr:GNAT family N-acetyltransferase [Polyangiales bacterium]